MELALCTTATKALERMHIKVFYVLNICRGFCNSVVQDGYTPLYVACQVGHKIIVDILLENGADVHLATVSILTWLLTLPLAM